MKAIHPNRIFRILIGAGLLLTLLLGSSLIHALIVGCPDSWSAGDVLCLFLPTHDDLGTHLLTYVLTGTMLLGTYFGLTLWFRQRRQLASLLGDLSLFQISDSGWPTQRFGHHLRDKVHFLDCEEPFCFTTGFISPHVFISWGIANNLTPLELEAIVLHEKYHIENRDPLKILLGKIATSALFFMPRYLIDKEVAADQSAIQYQGHIRGIAGALYKMSLKTLPIVHSAANAGDVLEYRIDYLTKDHLPNKPAIPKLHLAISSLVIASLILISLAPLPTHLP
jgi:Zn-dependent protease with chaperone function